MKLLRSKRQVVREDSDLVDEDDWTDQMQTELEYVSANPLKSNTTFFYRKIRTLTLQRDPRNGTYLKIICGHAPRIGCACRHVWCFLFTILKAIPRSLEFGGSVIQLCECLTSPNSCGNWKTGETHRPFSWEDFPQFNFENMLNMDVASKVKYHAVQRPDVNANSLFPEVHSKPFHPRMCSINLQGLTNLKVSHVFPLQEFQKIAAATRTNRATMVATMTLQTPTLQRLPAVPRELQFRHWPWFQI